MPQGMSIHIALNRVDPRHYQGWDGQLAGCIADANDMAAIANAKGFERTILLDEQATAQRVTGAISAAAAKLAAGDILFLTYSGHGGQVRDTNTDEPSDEPGGPKDETWCLYDRQLVDDELYGLWGRFRAGTRILLLSDSCHSGSVSRLIRQYARMPQDPELPEQFGVPVASAVRRGPPTMRSDPPGGDPAPQAVEQAPLDDVAALKGTRRMPPSVEEATETAHEQDYRDIQSRSPDGDRAGVGATVLLISGCQDAQLSSDGPRNGLFTHTLKQVWNGGKYRSGYRSFHKVIQKRMPIYQQPNLFVVGMPNPAFLQQAPFTI